MGELIKKQPYISGSMHLEVVVFWKVEQCVGYHHVLCIKNYFYEYEELDKEKKILFRD